MKDYTQAKLCLVLCLVTQSIGRYTTYDTYSSQDDTSFDYGTTDIPIDFTDTETTVPEDEVKLPQHAMPLMDTFTTSESLSTACIEIYADVFQNQARDMMYQINSLIDQLCDSNGYFIKYEIAVFTPDSENSYESGSVSVTYFAVPALEMTPSEVESCSENVALFAKDHSNWGNEIIPTVGECPQIIFSSEEFTHPGNSWVCLETAQTANDDNGLLSYSFRLDGIFEADYTLSPECTVEYATQLESEASQMALEANEAMGNSICYYNGESATVLVPFVTLSSQVDEAYMTITYPVVMTYTSTFGDFLACEREVEYFLYDLSNWRDPILTPESDCPDMVYGHDYFDVTNEKWTC